MNIPSINITFKEKAESVLTRGERGIVGLVIQDTVLNDTSFTVLDSTDIPDTISSANKTYIERALIGNNTAPKKVIVYVQPSDNSYDNAYTFIEESKADVVAFAKAETDSKATEIVTKIKELRDSKHRKVMCVLSNATSPDYEGIVNWVTSVYSGTTTIAPEDYTSRIAGAIAGTSVTSSITYMTLTDVDNCERKTDAEIQALVDAGKLCAMWDGEKVKLAIDCTSFVTTTTDKGESYKIIKLVRDMDLIYSDLYATTRDSYIGKYVNTYDNQCVLKTAYDDYLGICEDDGIIEAYTMTFNIAAKRKWIKTVIGTYPDKFVDDDGNRVAYEDMTDDYVKTCWTSNKVFLTGTLGLRDTMKEVNVEFVI